MFPRIPDSTTGLVLRPSQDEQDQFKVSISISLQVVPSLTVQLTASPVASLDQFSIRELLALAPDSVGEAGPAFPPRSPTRRLGLLSQLPLLPRASLWGGGLHGRWHPNVASPEFSSGGSWWFEPRSRLLRDTRGDRIREADGPRATPQLHRSTPSPQGPRGIRDAK